MQGKAQLNTLSPELWRGSCLGSECSFHQIAPYIGKMKSSLAKILVREYSKSGDVVLDPFAGSGTVALECLIEHRNILCCDTNPYAVALTKAKMLAPPSLDHALIACGHYLKIAQKESNNVDLDHIPRWIRGFFHPRTLKESVAIASVLRRHKQYFLTGCLLGILHHQRPGFLSYPASHTVPYLKTKQFPRENYPELYEYREVGPRLLRKVIRAYRKNTRVDRTRQSRCLLTDFRNLDLPPNSVDAVITSPPYLNALDYVRDNRLRLWFLGYRKNMNFDEESPRSLLEFRHLISDFFAKVDIVLKSSGACAIVMGDVARNGRAMDTHLIVRELASERNFDHLTTVEDYIPYDRRVRRTSKGTRREWIVVFGKRI